MTLKLPLTGTELSRLSFISEFGFLENKVSEIHPRCITITTRFCSFCSYVWGDPPRVSAPCQVATCMFIPFPIRLGEKNSLLWFCDTTDSTLRRNFAPREALAAQWRLVCGTKKRGRWRLDTADSSFFGAEG